MRCTICEVNGRQGKGSPLIYSMKHLHRHLRKNHHVFENVQTQEELVLCKNPAGHEERLTFRLIDFMARQSRKEWKLRLDTPEKKHRRSRIRRKAAK